MKDFNVWETMQTSGTPPPARSEHKSFSSGAALYIFGGINSSGQVLNDMYMLNLVTKEWMLVEIHGCTLPALYSMVRSYRIIDLYIYVYIRIFSFLCFGLSNTFALFFLYCIVLFVLLTGWFFPVCLVMVTLPLFERYFNPLFDWVSKSRLVDADIGGDRERKIEKRLSSLIDFR